MQVLKMEDGIKPAIVIAYFFCISARSVLQPINCWRI